ncbi:glucose-1-phosphate thymidylyltransferase [Staphylothermus hellenicus]|uniref:Glucose-1-phosphate thymidyltransferase n=1 Tax=Staphylothermus hellenicus (strain DSM 12710 / JCM 10830 / BK20S6-10-b1 / P8) TaxID=591019 RepID=D7D8B5_STAHD|nr:glucose-1-phosphate thymidylyltransferase [Staphylothermus hellenicus]ADI32011.1 glucose-1-phosphate thymidyltransferase [Staphylothermus hellenicus DSM 12710]
MKGVILHGGAGTRLRPFTFTGPKQLIPVANKPVSQYVLEDLTNSGIKDIAIVLGNIYPELVVKYYGDGSRFGCRITYINQGKPLGIAHAVGLAEEFVGNDRFVVYLGDNLLQHGIKKYVKRFEKGDLDALILLKEVEDPRRFGVAEFDENGNLVRLVEKPKIPPSNYALLGVYFFTPVIFDMIKRLKPSWRGEYEITDAIQMLIDNGYKVGYEIVKGWWFDTGKASDILTVNAVILDERVRREIKGDIINSKIEGRVRIGKGTRIIDSVVRGPAVIGEGCVIRNSFIGPYTSIGNNVEISGSSIEYCIILDDAVIKDIDRIEESLIGKKAKVIKSPGNRKFLKLNIGDYSQVKL